MSFRSTGPNNPQDLDRAVDAADTTLELYDVVAKALQTAGEGPPDEPWEELARRIQSRQPDLARALCHAARRWYQLQTVAHDADV